MTLVTKLSGVCADTTLPILRRDRVLENDNGGIKFLYDLAFPPSYSGGNPVAGSVISDISESSLDAVWDIVDGESVNYSLNGFDLSSLTKVGSVFEVPSSVAESVHNSVNDYFLLCIYVKLPTEMEWNTEASIAPFLQFSDGAYIDGQPELIVLSFMMSGIISARRQTSVGSAEAINVTPQYGEFAQISFWRDANGQGLRVKQVTADTSSTLPVGQNNTADFGSLTCKVGIPVGFNSDYYGGSLKPGATNAFNMKIYRGFFENLEISGRSPLEVMDDDWDRTIARDVFY